nr:MDIS1-interacting receptor like kinase 1 [Ipomoea batatas]
MKLDVTVVFIVFSLYFCHFGWDNYVVVSAKVEANDERAVLLLIKAGLVDPLGQLRDWGLPGNGSDHHCRWRGVKCSFNGAVEELDLSHMNLSGRVTDHIDKLESLTSLNLSYNGFSSSLPKSLFNLSALQRIDVSQNFFVDGFPAGLGRLAGLVSLNASSNNFSGYLPEELSNAALLESLDLRGNFFEGAIPKSYKNLRKLKFLGLSGNNLTGQIPGELGEILSLETIVLGYNEFEGEIPPQIANLKNLELLNLMGNRLSGSVPDGIANLTQLQVLELWNNSFSGSLPSDLGLNSPLEWLDVSSNSFSGPIPAGLCSKGNLIKLILFNNAFSGPIPPGLSRCDSLVRVRMQNNLLSGAIPAGFGKLGELQRLELANNSLTGQIPSDIASSDSLSFIDLSQNHLQSSLPSSILTIPSLQNFLASNNNLVGEIPDQFQDCPTLSVLDLSSNHLTGNIPASIASCEKLVTLNLRNNQISGPIPEPIASMPTLAVLDLSNNTITGGIPYNFGNSPALEMLNVSYNNLDGPVPANGMLRTINPDDLQGNPGLCGGVLPPCSQNAAYVSRQKSLRTKHIVAGWLIGMTALLAIVSAAFGLRFLHKRWYQNGSCFEERFETGKGEWPWRLMAFQRLGFTSNDILACIKDSNVIGMGATGVVYKTEMQRLNTTVAVKKLWKSAAKDIEMGSAGSEDLVGEVNVLGRLRHRNVVRLLGFLDNRSLEEALDPSVGNTKHVQEEMMLVLRIALVCTAKLPKERPSMRDVLTMLGEAKPRRKSSSVNGGGAGGAANRDMPPVFSTSPSFTKLSFNSSPNISPAVSLPFSGNGFRRAQSEGNLEGLAADALCNNADEFSLAVPLRKFARKPRASFLEAIPSFSLTGSRSHGEDEESDEYEEADEEWEAFGSANSGLSEELKSCLSKFPALEVAGVGFGSSGGYPIGGSDGRRGGFDGGDSHGISTEEHYRKMVEENPSNPLLLRNYAQFLYQTKKDAKKAEEYYSRAILADPGDGEVLSQYAKLIWEVHRDAENATSYFERAVQAAAGDSHVEAAYANFLWEVEDNEEEDDDDGVHIRTMAHERPMASASAC